MITLGELLETIPTHRVTGDGQAIERAKEIPIDRIVYHSKAVRPGDLFVCIVGFQKDGHQFAADAVARGARALLVERSLPIESSVPQVRVPDTRRALGRMADLFYGRPSRQLRLIGVTGTNGKTTTTHLIRAVLEASEHEVGLIGTIHQIVGGSLMPASRTTPESIDVQALLARMIETGGSFAVTEVSSHGVVLYRTEGMEYDVGVFTNITQDHLDFHKSFEEYLVAKARFFKELDPRGHKERKVAVINSDDPHHEAIASAARVPVLYYGIESPHADVRATRISVTADGVCYVAETPHGEIPLRLRLTGRFNVYNSLAAVAVGIHEGVAPEAIRRGLEGVRGVAGRFERVDMGQPFAVIVDYAHTPDGLENAIETAREITSGRLWVVFGCGGDRDRGKRPLMGGIARRLADFSVITSDNPRSEPPEQICQDVAAAWDGAEGDGKGDYTIIPNRGDAIHHAILEARPGDTVLIAGKGHETYQIFSDRTIPFDDREEARKTLREMGHGAVARQ